MFLEFENADWEQELADFHNTDVEVPARLIVDGQTYPDVGVHFRGQTSYMFVSAGRKRPLNLSLDFLHADQRLGGYRTLNLLNAHEDPSLLRTVLFYHIAREYFPAPKANFVRVVINGESWGIYVNAQQINKDFTRDFFGSTKGARWKVPGSPGGRGGLEYLGPNVADYQRIYEIKSKDEPDSWKALIGLCQVLDETAPENLQKALDGWLDVDGVLRFLAVDNALVNNDGFWTRASDYYLYRDERGCFHLIPRTPTRRSATAVDRVDLGDPAVPPARAASVPEGSPGRNKRPRRARPPTKGRLRTRRFAAAQTRPPPSGFAGPGGGRDGRGRSTGSGRLRFRRWPGHGRGAIGSAGGRQRHAQTGHLKTARRARVPGALSRVCARRGGTLAGLEPARARGGGVSHAHRRGGQGRHAQARFDRGLPERPGRRGPAGGARVRRGRQDQPQTVRGRTACLSPGAPGRQSGQRPAIAPWNAEGWNGSRLGIIRVICAIRGQPRFPA
ncbi:MAG: CotH kinase family protein [Verrucomicrobia bacterium]|nr:CotH kinase family protein [Verrucomicrobiota bacterium]